LLLPDAPAGALGTVFAVGRSPVTGSALLNFRRPAVSRSGCGSPRWRRVWAWGTSALEKRAGNPRSTRP